MSLALLAVPLVATVSLVGPVPVPTAVLAGGLLVTGAAAALLRRVVADQERELADVHDRLHEIESGHREDRARLHEIDSTVAGIASAQQLLSDGVPHERSEALAAMMRAEVERLHRLVAERAPVRLRSIDLDDVIGQIVLAHSARGRAVSWRPSGLSALAGRDDIAEILNVLLENAAVHGGSAPVTVVVDHDASGAGVTITVSDRGPGVAPALRDRLFDWGASRPGSPGQGIGLHVAAEIAHSTGGRLELVPSVRGACFVLHLPQAPQEERLDDRVAQAS